MTFSASLAEIISRIQGMEEAAVSGSRAFDNTTETDSANHLYWTNRVASITSTPGTDTDFNMVVMITMTLRTGWVTQGTVVGQLDYEINWTHIPAVMEYFLSRTNLVYISGQDPPNCLGPIPLTITCSGSQLLTNPTVPGGNQEVGAKFNLMIPTVQRFGGAFT